MFQVKRDMVAIKQELDTVQQVKEEIEELREYVDRLEEHSQRRKLRLLEQVMYKQFIYIKIKKKTFQKYLFYVHYLCI